MRVCAQHHIDLAIKGDNVRLLCCWIAGDQLQVKSSDGWKDLTEWNAPDLSRFEWRVKAES